MHSEVQTGRKRTFSRYANNLGVRWRCLTGLDMLPSDAIRRTTTENVPLQFAGVSQRISFG
jgi:hypothetical protein